MSKPILKISYSDCDFTGENLFEQVLSKYFNLVRDYDDPDLLICSVFGNSSENRKAKRKLLYIGENIRPYGKFDYFVGFDYEESPNYLRFPVWKYYYHLDNRNIILDDLTNKLNISRIKYNFASFTVSSPSGDFRNQFYKELSKYKRIESFGNLFNNNPTILRNSENSFTWQHNKINHILHNAFKFVIAMENSSHSGYTTEKLPDAMCTGAIPIYFGDPDVGVDFNKESFINVNYENQKEMIEYIIHLDNNDNDYWDLYNKPFFTDLQKARVYINELDNFLFEITKEFL